MTATLSQPLSPVSPPLTTSHGTNTNSRLPMARTSGICGNFNGVSTDDRVAPASYLVPANENIFTTRRAVAIQGTTIRTTTSCLIPTIANTNGCESEFMPTGWGTATPPRVQRRSPMPRRDKPSSPITTAKAKKMCGTIRRLVSACRLAEQPVDVERL
ncbi:hypothetical protein BC829DRAFT_407649 [Chytridium lagenaria]|nr:hypothetical protein BC829DRAFT_407649 [Chytridium lagenaria]